MSSGSDNNTCVLCCHKSREWAIGACNHAVCLVCSARMRVLCEQKDCPVCRLLLEQIVVVTTIKPFQDLSFSKWPSRSQLGMYFESKRLLEKFYTITDNRCNLCPDLYYLRNFRKLREHIKIHNLFFCEICVEGLKLFPSEFKMYTRQELVAHWRQGDKDDTSYKGHPGCLFCDERYLDNDALHSHLRKHHFWCHFCEAEGRQDFYVNCFSLRKHFKDAHYLCDEGNCRNEVLTSAFKNEIDLKAHRASVHGKEMSKAEAKQARSLPVAFTYTDHHPDGGSSMKRRGHSGGVQNYGRGSRDQSVPHNSQGPSDRGSRPAKIREREEREMAVAVIDSMGSLSDRANLGSSSSPVDNRKKVCAQVQINDSHQNHELPPPSPLPPPGFEKKSDGKTAQVISSQGGTTSHNEELKGSEAEGDLLNDSWPVLGVAGGSSQATKPTISPPPPGLWGAPKKEAREGKKDYSKKAAHKKSVEQLVQDSSKLSSKVEPVSQKPAAESVSNKPAPSKSSTSSNSSISGSRIFEDIRRALSYDQEKFKEFQSLSGWYRGGGLALEQYNRQCEELFGEHWLVIGPQLAKVMPPGKTRDKLTVYFATKTSAIGVSKSTSGNKQKRTKKNKAKMDDTVSNAWVTVGEDMKKPRPGLGGRGQIAYSEDDYPSLSTAAKLPPQAKVPMTSAWKVQVRT